MDFTEKGQTKETATIIFLIVKLQRISVIQVYMDYFAIPGRSCENLNFPAHLSETTYAERNLSTSQEIWHLSSDR